MGKHDCVHLKLVKSEIVGLFDSESPSGMLLKQMLEVEPEI